MSLHDVRMLVCCACLLLPAQAGAASTASASPQAQTAQTKAGLPKPAAKVPVPAAAAPAAKVSPVVQPAAVAQAPVAPSPPAPEAAVAAPGPGPAQATAAPGVSSGPAAAVAAPAPAAAPGPDWLSQTETPSRSAEPMERWPLVLAVLLVLAAGGAYMVLRARHGQAFWPGSATGHAIEILAVKALGHKHKLVLIEASGERLLLSATEREVRLISHVSSQEGLAIEAQADAPEVAQLAGAMGFQGRRGAAAAHAFQGPGGPMGSGGHDSSHPAPPRTDASAPGRPAGPESGAPAQSAAYRGSSAASVPMVAPQAPASHESLSAEALYEGAARSMDLDEQDDDLDEPQQAASPESPGALASDVAGLARWRQAAAQGAEAWSKQA